MSNDNREDFHKRLASLGEKPNVQARVPRTDRVGIYDFDEEKRRQSAKFPWRRLIAWVLIGIVGLILIKAFTVNKMGEESYQARLVELRAGDGWEPYAAIVVGRDPLMMLFERLLFSGGNDPETTDAPETSSEASDNANE